ncbi:MAG: UPF0058 family protein [Candidatus Nanohaloarchaeota archaeon QJJ-7]|nr:UPF0058 family protein [Candidatus Nanohaloarchaeota archaeon QJJ-7]
MKKQELIQLHRLSFEISDYLDIDPDERYEQIIGQFSHAYKNKSQQKHATFALILNITDELGVDSSDSVVEKSIHGLLEEKNNSRGDYQDEERFDVSRVPETPEIVEWLVDKDGTYREEIKYDEKREKVPDELDEFDILASG